MTPLDEVRGGLAVFEQTLWEALPRYVRQLDRALGEPLPLDAAPLRFGSWIGGDRDGNPNVTPEITRRATWMARWVAADLYLARDRRAPRGAVDRHRERRAACSSSATPANRIARCCASVAARLRATRALRGRPDRARGAPQPSGRASRSSTVDDLAAPLLLCHRSLVATGNASDRRRPPHRHPSARRGIRPDARAARPAAGRGAACRGGGVDRAQPGISGRTKTPPKTERSRC